MREGRVSLSGSNAAVVSTHKVEMLTRAASNWVERSMTFCDRAPLLP
jgi:hypothetical protein